MAATFGQSLVLALMVNLNPQLPIDLSVGIQQTFKGDVHLFGLKPFLLEMLCWLIQDFCGNGGCRGTFYVREGSRYLTAELGLGR
jgi:hypothetical protein